MIFTLPQLYFAFHNFYSANTIFDDWYITFYNCIFTFWPVVIRAVFEEDVYYETKSKNDGGLKKQEIDLIKEYYPYLYSIGQKNQIFTF